MLKKKNTIYLIAFLDEDNYKHTFYVTMSELSSIVSFLKKKGMFKDLSLMNSIDCLYDEGMIEDTGCVVYKQKTAKIKDLSLENLNSNVTVVDVIWAINTKEGKFLKLYKPKFNNVGVLDKEHTTDKRTVYTAMVKLRDNSIFLKSQPGFVSYKASLITNLRLSPTNIESLVFFQDKIFNSLDELKKDYEECDGRGKSLLWEHIKREIKSMIKEDEK